MCSLAAAAEQFPELFALPIPARLARDDAIGAP